MLCVVCVEMKMCVEMLNSGGCCCLPTPLTLVCGGHSVHPASGPPVNLSLHLASRSTIPTGSVHKSMGDNVVRLWVQLKR